MDIKKLNAIWMLVLVVSLPIYSASALAATVRITGNHGVANVENYIDANGDTWTVEATIIDAEEVSAENVILSVGSLTESFDTCSDDVSGTVCSYESVLNSIAERDYPFNVEFAGVVQSSVVTADGSGPEISGINVIQVADGSVDLGFVVRDLGDGLATVSVLSDDGNVLQNVAVNPGDEEVRFNDKLQGINSGEGIRVIRVRASDQLGHETVSGGVSFRTDFVAPLVEKVNITELGRFIGVTAFVSDVVVDVRENSEFREDLLRVSLAGSLENDNPNSCLRDDEQFDLWHCEFRDVTIDPAETMVFNIYSEDSFGNSDTVSRSLSFTRDSSPPSVEFFGSSRIFDGQSYVNNRDNRIVLRFNEVGAGIDEDGVRANLQGVGGSRSEAPHYFNETTGEAYWDVNSGSGGARISLVKLQDKAGNEDPTQLVETGLVVDLTAPRIERLEIFGVSSDDEHSFLQSHDQLRLVFTAREDSGLEILVNLNGLVDNAELKYLERGSDIPKGWADFTHNDGCARVEGVWECSILVEEELRSGTGRNVDLEMEIRDTAGNKAIDWGVEPRNVERVVRGGEYRVKLLGLSEEEDPDFWSVRRVSLKPGFVDLDTVELAPTRVQANVRLSSPELQASVIGIELGSCSALEGAPELRNSLFYGGIEPGGESSPNVQIVLEFDPFDGRSHFNIGSEKEFNEVEVEYSCTLAISSKLGRNAVRVSEIQEVPISVKFGFSSLGALDEGLAQKVTELKENDLFKISSALSFLSTGFKFLNFASRIFQIVYSANVVYDIFSTTAKTQAFAWRALPGAQLVGSEAWITALKGGCYSVQAGGSKMWEFVDTLQTPMSILSCNPGSTLGAYGRYQSGILGLYNTVSLRGPLGVPATSLHENLLLSGVGLCLPGLILNMEKARELHCRKIICYGREVPAGVATTESCDRLYDLLLCEYVVGTFFDFFLLGGISEIVGIIRSAFTSPLGLISIGEIAACWNLCWTDVTPGDVQACKVFAGTNKILNIIDNLVGIPQTFTASVGSQYCGQIDDIDLNSLTGGQFLPSEAQEEEESEEDTSGRPNVQPQTNI